MKLPLKRVPVVGGEYDGDYVIALDIIKESKLGEVRHTLRLIRTRGGVVSCFAPESLSDQEVEAAFARPVQP